MRTRALALAAILLPALAGAGVRPRPGGVIRIGVPTAPQLAPDAQGAADLLV